MEPTQTLNTFISERRLYIVVIIFCLAVCAYALYNIQDVQDRCASHYQAEMKRLNCWPIEVETYNNMNFNISDYGTETAN